MTSPDPSNPPSRPPEPDGDASDDELTRVVDQIRETNLSRFSSSEGRANLRVLDFTFEERWIYLPELIQNAVDAGATRIAIGHGADWLTLEHDGSEPLTEESVIGISGLFQSTKGVGTVGFMGIGFKSVFRKFQHVRVSGFGWRFRFDVEVTTGEEFGDRQLDLIGTVLPRWDGSIAPPGPGFTTRFELRQPLQGLARPASDIAHALPDSDRTVLGLLAHRGLEELRIGETCWSLECREEHDSHLAIATTDEEVERWRLFPVVYRPSKEAVARLLERRRIQPSAADRAKVYEEAVRPRTVLGVLPVDEEDVPFPPATATAYALLPTASTIPLGLHINADWLVTISRRGLPELEDNQWQNEIVDQIADVLASFLAWLGTRHSEPRVLRAGFRAVRAPAATEAGPIVRRMNSDEWKRRLQERLEDLECLPGFEGGRLQLRRPADTVLVPRELEQLADNPDALPEVLFGGPTISAEVMSRKGSDFVRWLGVVPVLTPTVLMRRWPEALEHWWDEFPDEADRRNLLFALWAAISRLPSGSGSEELPVVPTHAGTWTAPGEIHFPNESVPSADFPEVEAFLTPHLPLPGARPAAGLIEALRARAGADRRAAWEWFQGLATSVTLVDVANAAMAAEVTRNTPRMDPILRLTQWARRGNRADLISHVVVVSADERLAVAVEEALLAEPFVEHGPARRRIWPSLGVIVADYVEKDPAGGDAHEWRVFLERLGVRGPVRLASIDHHAGRYQPGVAAEFLGVEADTLGESNNTGYRLVDYEFEPPLNQIDRAAVAGWLEEGYASLKGKELRRVNFHYNRPYLETGTRSAKWVEELNSVEWVPSGDSSLRRPGDVLKAPDPAREDAPVAQLSDGLLSRLLEAGVEFGSRIPEAPILRSLYKRAPELTPEALAETIAQALQHVAQVPEDRGHLEVVLRKIPYPNGRGEVVPFERLIQTEGGGARSGFGGWLAPLNAMPTPLRSVLLDPRLPLQIPDQTTGQQALRYLTHVWLRAADGEPGLAQLVGTRLPLAYAYVLADMAEDGDLAEEWERDVDSAMVFTNRRRWVPAQGSDAPAFGDVEDSLVRRFLPADIEVATGGHLGETPVEQARTADALGLPRVSTIVSIEPKYGAPVDRPDWVEKFDDLLAVLHAARRTTAGQVPRVELRPTDFLAVEVDGDPKLIASFFDDTILHVAGAPREFAVDAVNHLVDVYGLSQQAKIAAMLTMLLSGLDHGEDFSGGLQRFGSEFAPDFDLSSLATIRKVQRPTPAGKIQRPAGSGGGEELEHHQEKLKRAAEEFLRGSGSGKPERPGGKGSGSLPQPDGPSPARPRRGPTAEQKERGLRGELEMLRRFKGDGGYLRLELIRDRRKDGCGYDFLCRVSETDHDVEVELKTYKEGGSVHLTLRELEQARKSGARYTLIGLIDDGGHPSGWEARRLDDPYVQLARLAEARIDVDFVLPATAIFPPGGEEEGEFLSPDGVV